jgi:predicted 3-demethylubiquinone-9 3-methyltransferase (glyoxalase superfamily)
MTAKNTVCLWFDRDTLDAAQFDAATFPDSSVDAVVHAPSDFPDGEAGDVLTVEFTVAGRRAPAGGARTAGACRGRSPTCTDRRHARPRPGSSQARFDAMMTMRKIDVAAVDAVRGG